MPNQSSSGPGRFLAPIALVVVAVAFFIVVLGSTGGSNDEPEQAASTSERQQPKRERADTQTETTETTTTEKATYTVKAGDSLAAIAEETGLTVEQIQELNPELDPQGLVVGQKIKLRE